MRARLLLILSLLACGGAGVTTTTIPGIARNAKEGAVVVREDGGAVFVDGLVAWPVDLEGRRVEVTGRLVRRDRGDQPLVNDAGEHSAGATGPTEVVEGARWRATSPTDAPSPRR